MSKLPQTTEISNYALRALVFWAAVGVREATNGSYGKIIEETVNQYARVLKMSLKKVAFKKVNMKKYLKGAA